MSRLLPNYYGPPLGRPFVLVLNSRQTKTPQGSEDWVKATIDAARYLAIRGETALTSIGTHPWNLTLWAISEAGGNQIIIHPFYENDDPEIIVDNLTLDYNLDPGKTGFVLYPTKASPGKPKETWRERDAIIIKMADEIMPISIRPGGNLASDIQSAKSAGKRISEDFHCHYSPKRRDRFVALDSDEIAFNFHSKKWDYVTHWTRTFNGPWPDETSADYYRAVAGSGDLYARSALHSLSRIISDNRIFAGDVFNRPGDRFASFTGLPPGKAVGLMKWHRRKVRYTFEPYGIAIRREAAEAYSIRKVIYGNPEIYNRLHESDKPYFQPIGGKGYWQGEDEWRYIGDINLTEFDPCDLLVIVRSKKDATELPHLNRIEVVALEE